MALLLLLTCLAFQAVLPAQVQVTVAGNRVITLAGQPSGTRSANNARSAPADSPVQVPMALVAGQALRITATGSVDGAGADGRTNCNDSFVAEFSITRINAPCRALVAVFLADSTRGQPAAGLDFTGDARELLVQRPLIQQPFLIGSGITAGGEAKAFVVPAGATRLFLSPLGQRTSTGEFLVTVSVAPLPEIPSNPIRVSAVSVINLAGQAAGTLSANNARIAPLHSPPQVGVPLVSGQALRIVATGSVEGVGPDGRTNCSDSFVAEFAIARVDTRCRALVGVFLADSTRPQPPNLNFTGATRNTARLEPLLQQPFLIGSGYTDGGEQKQFVVPAGATRFFLASMGSPTTAGSFLVTVSPDVSTTPVVQRPGIVRAAGLSASGPAPGSIVSIFGTSLAAESAEAPPGPLPTLLGQTRVYFNLRPAPLFFTGGGQINVQVPWELSSETNAQVVVVRNGAASLPVPVELKAASPGIFLVGEGAGSVVSVSTGQNVSETSGVNPGEEILIYGSGLGPVVGAMATGVPASSSEPEPLQQPVEALLNIGGRELQLTVRFAGSAPGMVGMNQVNAVIPVDAPPGTGTLKLRTGGEESNEVRIAILEAAPVEGVQ